MKTNFCFAAHPSYNLLYSASRKPLLGVDGMYVINLNKRVDRLAKFKASSGLDDDEYHRFAAIDSTALTWTDEIHRLFHRNRYGSSRGGIIGCALSHYSLWKHIASTNGELHLVLEDDAEFVEGWIDKWNYEYYPSLPKNR